MINLEVAVCLVVVSAIAGFGWGRYYEEMAAKKEKVKLESGRVLISMPMHKDHASSMMGMLRDLLEQVEHEQQKDGRQ